MQRAYQLNLDSGDRLEAVRSAFWLAQTLLFTGESVIGGGWVTRARRLLAEVPDDVVEDGYVLVAEMFRHLFAGEFAAARCADEVTDYGHRFAEPDLTAMGLWPGQIGPVLRSRSRGLALLDEAMICITTGGVSTMLVGHIYCAMIEACQEISDFGRAETWTLALTTWCADQPGLVMFTGQCAVHRGQLMRMHGAYDEADHAYHDALACGHEPQPGLALPWLARGRQAAALGAARRLLTEADDPVHRSRGRAEPRRHPRPRCDIGMWMGTQCPDNAYAMDDATEFHWMVRPDEKAGIGHDATLGARRGRPGGVVPACRECGQGGHRIPDDPSLGLQPGGLGVRQLDVDVYVGAGRCGHQAPLEAQVRDQTGYDHAAVVPVGAQRLGHREVGIAVGVHGVSVRLGIRCGIDGSDARPPFGEPAGVVEQLPDILWSGGAVRVVIEARHGRSRQRRRMTGPRARGRAHVRAPRRRPAVDGPDRRWPPNSVPR